MNKPASRIATSTADTLLAMFAGQTVSYDEMGAVVEQQYAMARRRTTYGSYAQIHNAIERAGARSHGGITTTDRFCTFPAN
ncbi:MAG: hypothetical protein K0U84_18585 [Actinomycetia bacterium]|nr:hypothetical protein [Actinomycetes bacterium]